MLLLTNNPTLADRSVPRIRNVYVWPRDIANVAFLVVTDARLTLTQDPLSVRRWRSWLLSPDPLSVRVHVRVRRSFALPVIVLFVRPVIVAFGSVRSRETVT
jgi:hypothetical protein